MPRLLLIGLISVATACPADRRKGVQPTLPPPTTEPVDAGPPPPPGPIATLEVANDSAVARVGEIAWAAIPIEKSRNMLTTESLALYRPDGTKVPAQFDVIARWDGLFDDASQPAQWVDVSVAADVPADGSARFVLGAATSSRAATGQTVSITGDGGGYAINTGAATFAIAPTNGTLITRIDTGGRTVFTASPGAGPRLITADGRVLDSATDGAVQVDPDGFEVVQRGPVKVVLVQRGHFVGPAGSTLCRLPRTEYERFGFTTVARFYAGSADVDLEVHFRNECGDAFNGPFVDQAVDVQEVSWRFPFTLESPSIKFAGGGAIADGSATTVVEQRKGGGTPWRRRARVLVDGDEVESGETFAKPMVAVADAKLTAMVQIPWMRYREPQGVRATGSTVELLFVSERLPIGEAKGIWNHARLSLVPSTTPLETARQRGAVALERGLLVRAPREHIASAGVFPSLGTDATSLLKTEYRSIVEQLHDDTVGPGGQWERAKTFGSQLWPDTQFDRFDIDRPNPFENRGWMNYWNPSGAELWEFVRSGDPEFAWEMALPASWLQMYSAYLNLGDHDHGNQNGFAITSGGTGEGNWHRNSVGSSDYSYNRGMLLAYLLRPSPALRDRFAEAGRTVIGRYSVPKADEADRERWVNQVVLSRQAVQHYEMLANCAQFVGGERGAACLAKLQELVAEMTIDNLRAGVMCGGDVPPATQCSTPQQFMINAMMYGFFMRYYRSWGDVAGTLRRALVEIGKNYYRYGIAKKADGSIDVNGGFAAGLSCTIAPEGTSVTQCTAAPDGDNRLSVYDASKAHTMAILLQAHELDPSAGLCAPVKAAYDDPALYRLLRSWIRVGTGYWKGANQVLQDLVFAVGIYDTCAD